MTNTFVMILFDQNCDCCYYWKQKLRVNPQDLFMKVWSSNLYEMYIHA